MIYGTADSADGATAYISASHSGSIAKVRVDGTTAYSYTNVDVGFYDGSLGNNYLFRGYAFFDIPDAVKDGIINSVWLTYSYAGSGNWLSVGADFDCYSLGQARYDDFAALSDDYVRWVALGGYALQDWDCYTTYDIHFRYPSEVSGLSELGVSFVPYPEYVDDPLGSDETYCLTLSSLTLEVNYTPADRSPDTFNFTDLVDKALNTTYLSDIVTISGINKPTSISVSQPGYYRIDSGTWTTSPGTISNGQTVQLKRQSSSSYGSTVACILSVGDKLDTWYITTAPQKYTLTVSASHVSYPSYPYNIEISSTTGHGGTTEYTKTLEAGTRGDLSAPYYLGSGSLRKRFSHWSGGEEGYSTVNFTMPEGNVLLMAYYVDDPETFNYTLTVNSSNPSSDITITSTTGHGGTTAYSKTVSQGSSVNLQAPQYYGSGSSRKRFSTWSGSVSSSNLSIGLTMDGTKTVSANYVDDPETFNYTLTVNSSNPSSGISITSTTGHGGTTGYNKTVSQSTSVNLQAPQYYGSGSSRKSFSTWSGSVSSSSQSVSFTMDGTKTVSANYVDDPEDDPDGGGYFDGDGRADIAVFDPLGGNWYVQSSEANNAIRKVQFGWWAVEPVPADYDGDRILDIAVYYPDGGTWYILQSRTGTLRTEQWGWRDAAPVPGDYDGDGITDIAVFHQATGNWYIKYTGFWRRYDPPQAEQFGWWAVVPVPADYDGDSITDIAVYCPSTGTWSIRYSNWPFDLDPWDISYRYGEIQWGWSQTVPVPGDYDGDRSADIAVFHRATGNWYIRYSTGNTAGQAQQFGWREVVPVPADYDGDDRTDIAVYHPPTGNWYIRQSETGALRIVQWGWKDALPTLLTPMLQSWYNLP